MDTNSREWEIRYGCHTRYDHVERKLNGTPLTVIPANAGIQSWPADMMVTHWIPACAGMTLPKINLVWE